jgi:hypothetical protein
MSKMEKFIVTSTSLFEKLLSQRITDNHLASNEQQLLKVLQNKNKTLRDRILFYNHFLSTFLKRPDIKERVKNYSDQSTQYESKKTIETPAQTDNGEIVNMETQTEPEIKVRRSDNFSDSLIDELSNIINSTQRSTNVKTNNQSFTNLSEDVFTNENNVIENKQEQNNDNSLFLNKDYDDEIDFSEADKNYYQELVNSFSPPIEKNVDFKVKHIGDPNIEYVTITHPLTGEDISVDKPAKLVEYQRRKAQQKYANLNAQASLKLKKSVSLENRDEPFIWNKYDRTQISAFHPTTPLTPKSGTSKM